MSKAAPRRRKKARPAKSSGSWFWRLTKRLFYWGMVLGVWGAVVVVGVLTYYAAHLPPTSEWKVPARPPNIKIVSRDGQLIANRGHSGGEAVQLKDLPPYLPEAVISIEDRRFYYHFGVDPIGLSRALFVNLIHGGVVQGGSTLTQQLAKNLFLEPDRTLQRKMQEVVLALWLEAKYSKKQILEMYLNRVYLGAGTYGVDAAARRYFGKPASQVTLAEAADLAGLLKAPSRYAPTHDLAASEARAKVVLGAMEDAGYITKRQEKLAFAHPLHVINTETASSANYVADWVMDMLPQYVGSIDHDVVVTTTLDMRMQHSAEQALRTVLDKEGHKYRVSQGAVVTLDASGGIKAMVGGRDYRKSQYNRAIYAKRQPGSSFKPFVYLSALERGLTPETVRVDEPITIDGWTPKNYERNYRGPVTLTEALSLSLNTVAARLAAEVGPETVIHTARRLGITSPLEANPSIALGTSVVTPLEMAGAYVPFSNGGYGVVPHIVSQISTTSGKVLYSRHGDGPGKVISDHDLAELNGMMAQTMLTGTGHNARLDSDVPEGGKTGTSQQSRDAWFIGYTGNLTTAVWVGNDNNSPTRRATGGTVPAQIWHMAMNEDQQGLPYVPLVGVYDMHDVHLPQAAAAQELQANTTQDPGRPIPPPPSNGGGPIGFLKHLFGG